MKTKKTKKAATTVQPSTAVAAGNGAAIQSTGPAPAAPEFVKVSTQAELDAALAAKAEVIEIRGEWDYVVIPKGADLKRVYIYGTAKVGSVYIYGTAKVGSVYIYGTAKVGSVYIYGTVTGSVYIYGTAKVGSVYIDGTAKVGSVDIYGTVTGSVYIYGTAREGVPEKKYFGAPLAKVQADHASVLALALPDEIAALRAALVAGKINGHLYEGECACLVGTLEQAGKRKVVPRNQDRLAEKWYMGISRGHTPENSTHAKRAVEWIDEFTAGQATTNDGQGRAVPTS